MSHGNTTQQREIIEFISYTFSRRDFLQYWTMKPAIAKTPQNNSLEDLGRATLQIVHDLKNQLNGLKLYATFLRKRLESEERAPEENETLLKLIAGLDRAGRDMTVLVRYSQPVELHRRSRADLGQLIWNAVRDVTGHSGEDALLTCEIEGGPLYGEFDAAVLTEALQMLTEEALKGLHSRAAGEVSLHAYRDPQPQSSQAVIEWRGVKPPNRNQLLSSSTNYGTVYAAQAARIIEAHDGQIERDPNTIRAWLPLSE